MSRTFAQQKKVTGRYLLTPTILVLIFIIFVPLLFSFVISFFHYTFIDPGFHTVVWFGNFIDAFQDKYFWNTLRVTLTFGALVVPLEFVIGFLISLLLSREIRFKGVYYTILTIPMVMSPVAVGLIWKLLLHPDLGVVNYFLSRLGVPFINWFASSDMALWTIVFVDIWHQVSFMILILLAGLSSLPKDAYEAAIIDGASSWQALLYITFPLMKPVITIAILIRTIFAFKTYDLIYIMTRGGPGVSTEIISYYIYKKTFMGMDLSQASAISYVLLVIVMLLVVLLYTFIVREKEEQRV
ncbi:ABC transporter permease subunit [candidate division KSB3 bacterium]|uniref:ABC transporter permease subunit n=1 Tax=candidate division KSB3 bacterium TaxID=2044937 RepID=A0A9D5JVN9_9BACT|nr:ABC transporter permease subunit [candidate division KSB3 bacterium]MBD3325127.1 ABC transporter permease subunit [candidate division KSB3 bacterium]